MRTAKLQALWSKKMKIDFNIQFDTDKKEDLDIVEELLFQLQDIKEIIEVKQENLNKRTTNKNKRREH